MIIIIINNKQLWRENLEIKNKAGNKSNNDYYDNGNKGNYNNGVLGKL